MRKAKKPRPPVPLDRGMFVQAGGFVSVHKNIRSGLLWASAGFLFAGAMVAGAQTGAPPNPKLAVVRTGGNATVTWNATVAARADLEHSPNLSSWTTVSANNTAGSFNHAVGTATRGFYRLRIQTAPFPIIGLSGNLSFGSATVNSTANRTLSISNTGVGNLTVQSIAFPPGFSGNFSGTIAAGATRNVTVSFTPVRVEIYGGNLTIVSDAQSGPGEIACSGSGVPADADNDGATDYREALDGTDPQDPTSFKPLSKGLVAYYPFNGNANDESGYGNNGVVRAAALAPDRFGEASSVYGFPGDASIDAHLDMGRPHYLQFAGDFTATGWAKFSEGVTNPRVLSYGQESGFEILTEGTGRHRRFRAHGGAALVGNMAYPENQWHMVAIVKNGENLALYVNGSYSVSSIATQPLRYAQNFQIGKKSEHWNDFFGGRIDDVRIYNRALAATELSQLFAEEAGGPNMALVPGGSGNETVPDFHLARFETTWGEWKKVRAWAAANGYDIANEGQGTADSHPVASVGWHAATKWCNAKSEMEGLAPVYRLGGAVFRSGADEPALNANANGYRLPTEAEWQWAASGGGQGSTYSGGNDLNAVAWYAGNSNGGTKPVGTKAANALGIFDMAGNVGEWCAAAESPFRSIRGGWWGESNSTAFAVSTPGAASAPAHGTGFRYARNAIDDLVPVRGGTLPGSSELAGRRVPAFLIGKYEVTWEKWQEVRGWAVENGYSDLAGVGAGSAGGHPVRGVGWNDAVKWSNARSEMEGLAPVYHVDGEPYKTGQNPPPADRAANGYRLPAEAEWEWAARGGEASQGFPYSGGNTADPVAWHFGNSNSAPVDLGGGRGTWPAGQKTPNELGLFDMGGNVREWCEDASDGPLRRSRGGSWADPGVSCLVANRGNQTADAPGDSATGFRLARNTGPKIAFGGAVPDAARNEPYGFTFGVGGDNAPVAWSIAGGTLPPGLSFNAATATISGTPTALGNYTYRIRLDSGANWDEVEIRHRVILPRTISLSGNLSFGSATVNTASNRTLSITNTGTGNLTVRSIAYSDPAFSGNFSGTVAPGATRNVAVSFRPDNERPFACEIMVDSDATSGNSTVAATGSGLHTRIIGLSGNLSFGSATVNTVSNRTLSITNTGTGNLTVDSISHPAGFSGNFAGTIAPGATQNVTVSFSPTVVQSYGGNLSAASDATSGASSLPVSGTGIAILAVAYDSQGGSGVAGGTTTTGASIANAPAAPTRDGYAFNGWFESPAGGTAISFPYAHGRTGNFTLYAQWSETRVISLSGNLSFGSATVNTVSNRTLSISNTGTGNLTVNSISYPAGFSGNFAGAIAPGATQNVTVSFRPDNEGAFGGNITVNSTATSGNGAIAASGTGAHTRIIGLTGNLSFGGATVNTTSNRTLSITNTGTGNLTVNSISYPTGFSGNFSGTVAPGATQNVTVSFRPDNEGAFGGNITVNSTATSGNGAIAASGTGVHARIIALSGNLSFGIATVNTTSNRTLSITNTGSGNLTVNSISYPTGFSGNFAGTIAPGATQNVTVSFTPTAVQSYSGNLSVNSNATAGTSTIALSGTGVHTRIIGLTGNLSFGDAIVNESASRMLTITNTGTGNLTITGITYPSGFSGNWSGNIAPGATQNVTVTFSPTSVQGYGGNLTVASNATSGASVFACSGNGIIPIQIIGNAQDGSIDFGQVRCLEQGTISIKIINTSAQKLFVEQPFSPVFSLWASFGSVEVEAGQEIFVPLVLSASGGPGPISGLLDFNYGFSPDSLNSSVSVPAHAEIVSPSIQITGDLSFGNVVLGETVQREITITNNGKSYFNGGVMARGEISNLSDFSVNVDSVWIAPGGSQNVAVTFSPTQAGSFSGSIYVYENQIIPVYEDIAFSGSGIQPEPVMEIRGNAPDGSIDFGQVPIGAGGAGYATITIANTGTGRLNVNGVWGSLPQSNINGAYNIQLDPGEETSVWVSINDLNFPSFLRGPFSGTLGFVSDAINSPSINFTAELVAPEIEITGNLDFGDVAVGETAQREFTIKNTGNAGLSPHIFNYVSSDISLSNYGSLGPGESQNVTVTFSPSSTGIRSGSISIFEGYNVFSWVMSGISFTGNGVLPGPTDSDGDGVSDYREQQDGTDPNNSASFNYLSNGLVAYYPFNGNANDESGYQRDGVNNGATLSQDRIFQDGQSFYFNGENYITIPNSIGTSETGSVALWFKSQSWSPGNFGQYLFSATAGDALSNYGIEQGAGGGDWINLGLHPNETGSNALLFGMCPPTGWIWANSGSTPPTHEWNQVVGTWDGSKITIYLNGIKKGEISKGPVDLLENLKLHIGASSWTDTGFEGNIDDVRIYNRALSAAEVSQLFSEESGEPNMILVQGGTLPAGSELANQTVSAFHIARFETTWAEWKEVRDWASANGYDIGDAGQGSADNHPVRNVSWYDAVKWCNAKSEMEGLTPVYQSNGTIYRAGDSVPTTNTPANGYRLPAEAEWEWAARGGVSSQGYTYSGSNDVNSVAWIGEINSVATKNANELGTYDMSGNVFEWCWDSLESYPSFRVFRGGGWLDGGGGYVTGPVSLRDRDWPDRQDPNIGFRYARNAIGDMVAVQGGTLPQSSELAGETVQTFEIGRTEVTWDEWQAVRDWAVASGYSDLAGVGNGTAGNHPVRDVSWYDVIKWSNAKSHMEGLVPVYYANGTIFKTGESLPTANPTANGYRLPAEVEWEWTASGGVLSKGYTYSGSNDVDAVAWFFGNSGGTTKMVGMKTENELGIFDMSGNVHEWSFNVLYPSSRFRGGSWSAFSDWSLLVSRGISYFSPSIRFDSVGFRLARNIGPKISITGTLPEAVMNQPYAGSTFNSTASDSPIVWSTNGTLPPGMSLSANGTLSGTPTAAGTYTFVVRLDSGGYWDEVEVQLAVVVPVALWSGGAGNWSQGFSPMVFNSANVVYTGAGGGNSTNDLPTSTLSGIGSLTFNSTAGAFTLAAGPGSAGHNATTALLLDGDITNNSASTQTVNLALTTNATRVFDAAAGNITVGGAIGGTGGISKNGTATLTLTGNNTFTGAAAVNSGTLAVSNSGALGSASSTTVAQDAQLRISGNATINRPLFLNGGSGTDSLGDIYSIGNTTISAHIHAGGNLPSEITANNNGRISITGGISGTQEIMLSAPAGATIEVSGNGISTTGAQALETRGAGLVLLNAPNTFTGAIQTDGGNLEIGPSGSLHSGNASNILQVRLGNFTYSGTGNQILSGTISDLGGGPGRIIQNSNGTLTLTGNSTYNGGLAIHSGTLEIGGAGRLGSGNLTGAISLNGTLLHSSSANQVLSGILAGAGSLTKNGTGTLTLSGNNSYTGATTINAGILNLGASDRISNSSPVTISGGTLDIGAHTDTVGAFAITSGHLNGSGTLTATNAYALQGGTINAKLGAGAITVSGGTTTLGSAGRLNTASTLAINSGNLTLGGDETVAALSGSGGTLLVGGKRFTVNQTGDQTFSGAISGAGHGGNGGFFKTGNGTLTLAGSHAYTSNDNLWGFQIYAGNVTLGANDRIASNTVSIHGGALNLSTFNETVGVFYIWGGSLAGTGTLTAGRFYLNGGTVDANLGAGEIDVTYNAGGTLLNGTTSATLVTLADDLTLGSANRLALGANVTILSGTLRLGGNETVDRFRIDAGSLAGTGHTLTATNGYALRGGTIGANLGAGTITVTNSLNGPTTLSGTAASTAVNINSGNLTLGAANRLADTAAVTVNATFNLGGFNETIGVLSGNSSGAIILGAGNLVTDSASSGTYAGGISGSGGLAKNGTGTLTLSGNNTYTGATTIHLGTLSITGNTASSATTVGSGGALTGTGTAGAVVVNSGGLLGAGTGTSTAGKLSGSTLTINGGSGYAFTIANISGSGGTAGTDYDQIALTGALALNNTAANKFTLSLYGTPAGWNGENSYAWDFLTAASQAGFSAGNFTTDFTNFGIAPELRAGNWTISNPTGGTLRLSYTAAPTITSAAASSATVGAAFSYQITATNNPTGFGASGLPGGLSLNATTGLVNGTPTVAGNFTVNLTATNAAGTRNATLALSVAFPPPVVMVTTLAGSGNASFVDASGSAASFNGPNSVAVDNIGNIYVADQLNHCIRKVSSAGVVTTLAGSGLAGFADGNGTDAGFNYPSGVALDGSGNVYVADSSNHRIRKIAANGTVITLAGSGTAGSADGNSISARFNYPSGLTVDGSGNVYVGDNHNHRIRKITANGTVTTLAGSGIAGSTDGNGTSASFTYPKGVAVDGSGDVYVGDTTRIRKITANATVATLAGSGTLWLFADGNGTSARFAGVEGVAVDGSGNVYVGDKENNRIRKITANGTVTTLAGNSWGYADGGGTDARFYWPCGVAVDGSGNVYVADFMNHRIRKITIGPKITIAGMMPNATLNQSYAGFTFNATGTNAPVAWSVSEGSPPPGMSLNSTTGLLSGTPTTAGTYTFVVRLDSGGYSDEVEVQLQVYATLSISLPPSGLPAGGWGDFYEFQLGNPGGIGPYAWQILSGDLPEGVTLTLDGRLQGIPLESGAFSITTQVTDSLGMSASLQMPLLIAPASNNPSQILGSGIDSGGGLAKSGDLNNWTSIGSPIQTVPATSGNTTIRTGFLMALIQRQTAPQN